MTEVWKAVIGYEGIYEVSDHGRVRSLDRVVTQLSRGGRSFVRRLKSTMRRQVRGPTGHFRVSLWRDDEIATRLVHRLVAEAFIGPCPLGQETRHKDGDAGNNHVANLEYGTRTENRADMRRHGTHPQGEGVHNAVLTEKDVRAIRAARGAPQQALADAFGCSRRNISLVMNRETWRHV